MKRASKTCALCTLIADSLPLQQYGLHPLAADLFVHLYCRSFSAITRKNETIMMTSNVLLGSSIALIELEAPHV